MPELSFFMPYPKSERGLRVTFDPESELVGFDFRATSRRRDVRTPCSHVGFQQMLDTVRSVAGPESGNTLFCVLVHSILRRMRSEERNAHALYQKLQKYLPPRGARRRR